jgi:hypothetical protein
MTLDNRVVIASLSTYRREATRRSRVARRWRIARHALLFAIWAPLVVLAMGGCVLLLNAGINVLTAWVAR